MKQEQEDVVRTGRCAQQDVCPECEGTNLSEDRTQCFNCQAEDYAEGREV